jgi:phospholipid/cholesterol/gamma-HCH transport system substrate-binding protein
MIGAFVMIAIAAAFAFVLWIGSAQREYDEYDVIFNDRVTGLSTGSIVRFNGIQKGEVESLSIDEDDPSIVIARVRVDKDTPIKTDTRVELEPVGFTGLAIIQFVGGGADEPLLKDVEDGVPQLEADTGGINMLLESSGDLFARANLILSDENIANISKTLDDIQVVTGAIAENRDEISELIKNANAATAEFNAALENLRDASDGLEKMLSEDGPEAVRNADALITDIRALIAETDALVSENRESFKYFTDQGLGQVAPALAEARALMRSLDNVLREIERDPKAFFLGEATPEYEAEGN